MTPAEQLNVQRVAKVLEAFPVDLGNVDENFYEFINDYVERNCLEDFFDLLFEYYCIWKNRSIFRVSEDLEKTLLVWALLKFDGCKKNAAQHLGIGYSTLFRKLSKHGICCKDA
jgi:DNA-binding protein Fis